MQEKSVIQLVDIGIIKNLAPIKPPLDDDYQSSIEQEIDFLASALSALRGKLPYHRLPAALVNAERRWRERSDAHAAYALKALLFKLVAGFESGFPVSGLPAAFQPYFLESFRRIVRDWHDQTESVSLTNNAFVKDLNIAALRLVPAAARVLDPCGGFPVGYLPTLGVIGGIRGATYLALAARGMRPFIALHVHDLQVERFSRAGFIECLALCGRLLASDERLRGILGGSWFYDPKLATVSPNLGYLHDIPVRHGALYVRGKAEASSAALALKRSPTRRAAHEAGRYTPEYWWMMWSRDSLLAALPDITSEG